MYLIYFIDIFLFKIYVSLCVHGEGKYLVTQGCFLSAAVSCIVSWCFSFIPFWFQSKGSSRVTKGGVEWVDW